MNIILTGGTGFIGNALQNELVRANHKIVLLTRNPSPPTAKKSERLEMVPWDSKTSGPWISRVDGADAIINLAGESIAAKRWTESQKARIVNSRVDATKAIISAVANAKRKPSVLINASAVGYYGNVEREEVSEEHPPGNDFLATTCARWETEARAAEQHGVRVVLLRFGIVLEKDGGALKKMLLPFRLFIGGPLGSGRQWFPWVHREDVIGAVLFALESPRFSSPANVTAPDSVTMKQFCQALGKVMNRPSWAPVPAFVLQLGLGEMSEMLLTGQRAVPKKLIAAGYKFKYPTLDEALRAIVRKSDLKKLLDQTRRAP